jgi:hypothetical protein
LKKIATFLYNCIFRPLLTGSAAYMKVERCMTSLHPGKNKEQLIADYYIEKIRASALLFLAVSALATLVGLNAVQKSTLEGALVPKNTWEQGSYALDLVVEALDYSDSSRSLRIQVEPISLSEGEVSALAKDVFAQLEMAILGTNTSLSAVTAPLDLIERLAGFPFIITWESDRPLLVRADGRINNEDIGATGEIVKLTALLVYEDQLNQYSFSEDYYICLAPAPLADADEWAEAIRAAVAANQQVEAFTDSFHLPGEVSGVAVAWQEKKTSDGRYLWLMAVFAAVLAFVGKDQDLQKRVAQRNKQIDRDYPELVRKLALYLGAGMTVRGAWKRVAYDYTQRPATTKSKYVYEEMLYSLREMDNGVPEREVYEHFGKRVGIAKYRKLTGLFCNHLQKGNNNLLRVLRDEVELALEDRKKAARAIGEEMSTKLLLPMMMMLVIVMVIIMVPAFQMF